MTTKKSILRHERDLLEPEFAAHAAVYAIIVAYRRHTGPIPWDILLKVGAGLHSLDTRLSVGEPYSFVQGTVVDVCTDLDHVWMISRTERGLIPGPVAAPEGFEKLVVDATNVLRQMRFPDFQEV